jgi:anaerobic selenocysteine-containing dehydrogenase
MDCPDTCSLDVEVRDGRVEAIRGSKLNPTTAGFICSKVANFTKRLYSEERILHPMRRTGKKGAGEFERISWDEATRLVSSRFKAIIAKYGGEAILPYSYGGSNAMLGQDTTDLAYFAKLGASRLARTVCAAPTAEASAGMYGKMPGVAFEDYVHAKLIVIWGANPKASNIHLVPFIKQARERGAKVAIVDPKLSFSSREYDLHLPVFPGADLAVALAMIRYWNENNRLDRQFLQQHARNLDLLLVKASKWTLERAASVARVPASEIEKLAVLYAEASPALLRCGWGLERNRNGGSAVAAILAMPALLGKFGARGGGYTLSNSAAAKVNTREHVDAAPWETRVINMNLLGKTLLDENNPPVKALFVYNNNLLATTPNQNAVLRGLQREDLFTIVSEQVITDTALYADLLLPAVTFLEHEEIKKGYGTYAIQYSDAVIDRCGEALPNQELFALLGRAMGWTDPAFQMTTEDCLNRVAGSIKGMGHAVTLEQLRKDRIAFYDFPERYPVQFKTVFPWTPDGKIDLAPDRLGNDIYEYIEIDERYPLALISPSNNKMISSSFGEYNYPELYLSMHPDDAAKRNLDAAKPVRVFNELGEVHCKLHIDARVREGVVAMPKGAWRRSSLNGFTSTALSPDTLGTGGGACFNDARVQVEQL